MGLEPDEVYYNCAQDCADVNGQYDINAASDGVLRHWA